jgi:hypothetical protein
MYLLLLIADTAGEKTLETMAGAGAASPDSGHADNR